MGKVSEASCKGCPQSDERHRRYGDDKYRGETFLGRHV